MQKELPIKVYTPHSKIKNPLVLIIEILGSFKASNQLGYALATRDIKSQYRQSVLGIFWAFINPVFNTILWIFLSKSGVVQVADTAIPYPLYVFIGTMLWGIFTDSIISPITQTNAAKGILTKINFPVEAIIVSTLYQNLFNALIKVALIIIAIFAMGVLPNWNVLLFPLGLLALMLTGTAIGLLLTPIGVLYGDISRALPFVLQMAMYATPIVLVAPKNGLLTTLFKINPFSTFFLNTRNWLTGQPTVEMLSFAILCIVFLIILFIGIVFFRVSMPVLVQRMSS